MKYYLISTLVLSISSCNTVETTAFRFKDENFSLDMLENNLDITISNTISTNQVYQGMNSHLDIRSTHDREVFVDSIQAFFELKNQTSQAIISKSFATKEDFEFPILMKPNDFRRFEILTPNQEDFEIEIGDSVSLQINIYHNDGMNNDVSVVDGTKFYERYKYTVMP